MATGGLHKLGVFSTPLFIFESVTSPGNAELTTRLLDERGAAKGQWQSPPDLSGRPDLCYQAILQAIVDRVTASVGLYLEDAGQKIPDQLRYGLRASATIDGDGDYTPVHDHPEAHWSTAYYLDAGDVDLPDYPDSGVLVFVDPRRAPRPVPGLDLFPSRFAVKPRTGMLVIFPAYLQHYVHPYRGKKPRITLTANLTVLAQE